MKIALLGASGTIGQRIAQEALTRGHQITALIRNADHTRGKEPRISVAQVNIFDPASVAEAVRGYDVVIKPLAPAEMATLTHRCFLPDLRRPSSRG